MYDDLRLRWGYREMESKDLGQRSSVSAAEIDDRQIIPAINIMLILYQQDLEILPLRSRPP